MYQLYRDLLALRDEEPMLLPDGADITVGETQGCITMVRRPRGASDGKGGELVAVFNCTAESHEVSLPDGLGGRWTLRLTTDATGYGGEGRSVEEIGGEELAVGAASAQSWNTENESLGSGTSSSGPRRVLSADTAAKRAVVIPPWSAAVYIRQ
jgi:hypothetical protein